jgi:hypothetical protein
MQCSPVKGNRRFRTGCLYHRGRSRARNQRGEYTQGLARTGFWTHHCNKRNGNCAPKRADSGKVKQRILVDKKTSIFIWLAPQAVLSLTDLKENNRVSEREASSAVLPPSVLSVQLFSLFLRGNSGNKYTAVNQIQRSKVLSPVHEVMIQLTRDVHCDAVGEASWRRAREDTRVLGLRVIHRQPVLPLAFLRCYCPTYTQNYTFIYTAKT